MTEQKHYPAQVGIDAYGNGGFRFAGISHRGGLLCLPTGMFAWPVTAPGEVTLAHGGSITACHGATREGDADLVPAEMGSAWPVVLAVKRALDPNNIMNPGKQRLDEAYEEVV